MVGCSAAGCSNNSKNGDWSFHRLPKKKELHKKWLQAMKTSGYSRRTKCRVM